MNARQVQVSSVVTDTRIRRLTDSSSVIYDRNCQHAELSELVTDQVLALRHVTLSCRVSFRQALKPYYVGFHSYRLASYKD